MHHGTVLEDGNKKSVLLTLMGMTNFSVVFSRIDFNTDTTIASAALIHFGGRKTSFRYRIWYSQLNKQLNFSVGNWNRCEGCETTVLTVLKSISRRLTSLSKTSFEVHLKYITRQNIFIFLFRMSAHCPGDSSCAARYCRKQEKPLV